MIKGIEKQGKKTPITGKVGLPNLVNKNIGHIVKFEFQINNGPFFSDKQQIIVSHIIFGRSCGKKLVIV